MRRRATALVCAATVVALGACSTSATPTSPVTSSASTASSSEPSPLPTSTVPSLGSAGLGDPYFPGDGNGGYDAVHYDLAVTVKPDLATIEGTSSMVAVATQALSGFHLDLHSLTVHSVTVDGRTAAFTQDGSELVVTPSSPLVSGASFTTRITYSGAPTRLAAPDVDNGWYHDATRATVLGEPQAASMWFPVNEHPSDKATYNVVATVPAGKTAVSNGLPVGDPVTRGALTTWHWRSQHPMASYLVLLAIGDYTLVRTTSHSGIPIIDAVDPSVAKDAAPALAQQSAILDFLAADFGPYPFEAAGAVIARGLPEVALETQTRSLYAAELFGPDGNGPSILVHETAHQWFGDSVSLSRWRDIWLNEGFATYAELLWAAKQGTVDPTQVIPDTLSNLAPDDALWQTDISNPGTKELFGGAVYQRGSLVLEALREVVGDDAFFTTLRRWAAEHRDGNGTTAEFVALAQKVSTRDLTEVFDTWLYGAGKPDGWDPAAVARRHPLGSAPVG